MNRLLPGKCGHRRCQGRAGLLGKLFFPLRVHSTVVGILHVTERLWNWRQLSGESHKEGRLYQAGSFMARRRMVAKKRDGGMYIFLLYATIPYIGILESMPQKH